MEDDNIKPRGKQRKINDKLRNLIKNAVDGGMNYNQVVELTGISYGTIVKHYKIAKKDEEDEKLFEFFKLNKKAIFNIFKKYKEKKEADNNVN